jgi:hypothetical protein
MPFGNHALAAAAILTIGLGGCQGSGSHAGLRGSPAGVPILFESIDGPPAPVKTALAGELSTAARERHVSIANAGTTARYRVRGYVSTEKTAEGGAALAFVWDVFDAEKHRAKRITGSSPVTGSAASWSGLDEDALAQLAAQSMVEIATFLSEAPATVASASSTGDPASPPLSFAAQ